VSVRAATRLSAVLLAAGESKRAGTPERPLNKLLVEIEGEPLVRRSARRLCDAGFAEVVVVVGHQADRVEAALAGLPLRCVRNPDYRKDQATSMRRGLEALALPTEGVMICLADQPKLEVADLETLARAFVDRRRGEAIVPVFDGRRGNPIVLTREAAATILERGGRFSCRRFIEENAELVAAVVVSSDAFVVDLDHADELAAWTR
jgi:molybdenum cofactor cytidylyltransferase